MKYELYRSALFGWLVGIASVPLVLLGFDVLVLPKVGPGYTRFIDRLADLAGLNRPGANGSEEAWALIFTLAGVAMLMWSTKEMFAPRPVLRADQTGVTFNMLGGPAAGTVLLPWEEVTGTEAVVLEDADGDVPALRVRVVDARRLPSHPWGGEWVDGALVLRANAWVDDPIIVAARLDALRIGALPPDVTPDRAHYGRVAWGVLLVTLGLVVVGYLLFDSDRTANWPFIPAALLAAFGLLVVVAGMRQAFDTRYDWMAPEEAT